MTDSPRTYDLVLFGATGFTGTLTAEYLARNAPAQARWALAGRDQSKLGALRERLSQINPAAASLDLLHAEVSDQDSLARMTSSSRVVASTVGPYIRYGEPLVAACAQNGTDYLDLTGEPEFVDLMYARHHRGAQHSGARIVHCAGFESIPYDLGVYFTVGQLPREVPLHISCCVRGEMRPSAGTIHSGIEAFGRVAQTARAASQRRRLEGDVGRRRVKRAMSPPRHDSSLGGWVAPMPTIDPLVIVRSARALKRYGPDFTYEQNFVAPRAALLAGGVGGALAIFALAQLPPTRRMLLSRFSAGDGPSVQQRERAWYELQFVGRAGDRQVRVKASGGDPAYEETAKILAESALCLALDELPQTAGQVTAAQAMGDALIGRLERAGLAFTLQGS